MALAKNFHMCIDYAKCDSSTPQRFKKKEIMVIAISNHVEQLKRKKKVMVIIIGKLKFNMVNVSIELNLVELDELQFNTNWLN